MRSADTCCYEFALYYELMVINFYDVRSGIDSLKGDEITRVILWPGTGVGGHCLTKDTYHLERGPKVLGGNLDYPEGKESLFVLVREINDVMPRHMFRLLSNGLGQVGKKVKGANVALLGWSFLADTDDARNTPAELFWNLRYEVGVFVKVHDPWVRE